jgi:hypothetical protein
MIYGGAEGNVIGCGHIGREIQCGIDEREIGCESWARTIFSKKLFAREPGIYGQSWESANSLPKTMTELRKLE